MFKKAGYCIVAALAAQGFAVMAKPSWYLGVPQGCGTRMSGNTMPCLLGLPEF